MKSIINGYEEASGQQINFQKSEIYCSRNVEVEERGAIASILEVQVCLGTSKYLGLPSVIGRRKKSFLNSSKTGFGARSILGEGGLCQRRVRK